MKAEIRIVYFHKITGLLAILMLCFAGESMAQKGPVAAGGDAKGTGGSVTYSVGQIDYITVGVKGEVITQGLQQPFEVLILIGKDPVVVIDTGPELSIYPNPTTDFVVLKLQNAEPGSLTYSLYDLLGRLIKKEKLNMVRTTIPMADLPSATYILTVYSNSGGQIIKTFKIIKI